jgi:hypothetical protein
MVQYFKYHRAEFVIQLGLEDILCFQRLREVVHLCAQLRTQKHMAHIVYSNSGTQTFEKCENLRFRKHALKFQEVPET